MGFVRHPASGVLVTGASGFIGGRLCASLVQTREVRGVVRTSSTKYVREQLDLVQGDLSAGFDWSAHLKDVSAIVHCAARVHIMKETSATPLEDFRAVNVGGTMNLAQQAARAGVGRFVFISSIGVNGLETGTAPFRSGDAASPQTDYAISKYEAEQELMDLAGQRAMEVVIIRPPLVYGSGAPGNFSSLMKCISRGIPMPLGAVTENRRSFMFLRNLTDLIEVCLDHPAAANQVFLAADGEVLSTADLLIRIGRAMGRPTKLIPVPTGLLYAALSFVGKSGVARSLCRSLEIDISKTRGLLGWSPAVTIDEGLCEVAANWSEYGASLGN